MTETPGVEPVTPQLVEEVYEDYFGFEETKRWYFPDGKQYIEFKVMTEGDKAKFQKATNRDIKLSRNTGDATIQADPATERHALIDTCVVNWFVFQGTKQVTFSNAGPGSTFQQWLSKANPKFVEDLEWAIRRENPWLQADMTIEEIDKEIKRLYDLRADIEAREAAKAASSVK
jgi:hypothetical protein